MPLQKTSRRTTSKGVTFSLYRLKQVGYGILGIVSIYAVWVFIPLHFVSVPIIILTLAFFTISFLGYDIWEIIDAILVKKKNEGLEEAAISQLLEEIENLDTLPKSDEIDGKLKHIQDQILSVKKDEIREKLKAIQKEVAEQSTGLTLGSRDQLIGELKNEEKEVVVEEVKKIKEEKPVVETPVEEDDDVDEWDEKELLKTLEKELDAVKREQMEKRLRLMREQLLSIKKMERKLKRIQNQNNSQKKEPAEKKESMPVEKPKEKILSAYEQMLEPQEDTTSNPSHKKATE